MIMINDTFKSNSKEFCTVVEYNNCDDIVIEYSDGTRSTVTAGNLRSGYFRNRNHPSVLGRGCLGYGKHKTGTIGKKGSNNKYACWTHMLSRCYNCDDDRHYAYGKIGVTVCDEWLNFQVFGDWYDEHYISGYELDKDIKVHGNKIYNPEGCMFVTKKQNAQHTSRCVLPTIDGVEYKSLGDAARKLGVSVPTIHSWCKTGRHNSFSTKKYYTGT